MVAEVSPLLRLSRTLSFFDYAVPEDLRASLKRGHLVTILFRTKKIPGIVIGFKKTSEEKHLASILAIPEPTILLSEQQLTLAKSIATTTGTSLGLVFRSFLPDIPKRKSKALATPSLPDRTKTLSVSESSVPVLKDILATLAKTKKKELFLWTGSRRFRYVIFLKLIERAFANKQSLLIFFPEIEHLVAFSDYLPKYIREKTVAIHGQLKAKEFFYAWQRVEQETPLLILATRSAVLFPFQKIEWILLDDAESSYWKQEDQNPRYETRRVVEQLALLHDTPLLFSGTAPTALQHYRINNHEVELLPVPKKHTLAPTLIDIREEHRARRFSLLTPLVHETIQTALAKKQSVVLFLNRLGYSTFTICQDCHHVFACTQCQFPLTTHHVKETSFFRCHHCEKDISISLSCPRCHGNRFYEHGVGLEKIQEELITIFGDNPNIMLTTHPPHTFDAPLFASIVLSADTFLYLPFFDSAERTYLWLSSIRSFTEEHRGSHMIVQTFTPEHPAIQAIINDTPELFYTNEQEERKKFFYPPFCRLVQLLHKDATKDAVAQESARLFSVLKTRLQNEYPSVQLLEPSPPYREFVRGKFLQALLLKVPVNEMKIFSFLNTNVPPNWIINVDPVTL